MTEQRRRHKRWRLIFYPSVYNERTGQVMGHLLDVTLEGMKLISQKPLPIRRNYLVGIEFTADSGNTRRITLEARSLWSERDSNALFFDTGFKFMNISNAIIMNLQQVIDTLKSRY